MKKTLTIVVAAVLLVGLLAQTGYAFPRWGFRGFEREKNPAFAALLNLNPSPVALGHFYADDWQGGLLFSAGETVLLATGIGVSIAESARSDSGSKGDSKDRFPFNTFNSWTDTSKAIFISAAVGYVGLKFWSAFGAAVGVEERNASKETSMISPYLDGEDVGVSLAVKF